MKYMGGKFRIANHIVPIMLKEARRKGITTWVEPFVGGANVIDKVPNNFERIGIDLNPHTIAALIAIRDFANELPDKVSEAYYKQIKNDSPDPIKSWIRFVCSYGAKFNAGFARDRYKKRKNFALEGKNSALRQSPKLQGVKLLVGSYDEYEFENALIYCDPPYRGTTGYATGKFDHDKFWQWCRKMSKKNVLFVSEYQAPADFVCIWEGEIKQTLASQRTKGTPVVERLFRHKDSLTRTHHRQYPLPVHQLSFAFCH